MADSTQPDLNKQIENWRLALASSPGLSAGDLEEMEAHLRDAIAELESKGLSTDEAFLVARKRLGGCEEIQKEFEKSNPSRVWADRMFWAIGFVLVSDIVSSLFTIVLDVSMAGAALFTHSPIGLSAGKIALNMAGSAALFWFMAQSIARGNSLFQRLCNAGTRNLGLSVFALAAVILMTMVSACMVPVVIALKLPQPEMGKYIFYTNIGLMVQPVILYGVMIVAARSIRSKQVPAVQNGCVTGK